MAQKKQSAAQIKKVSSAPKAAPQGLSAGKTVSIVDLVTELDYPALTFHERRVSARDERWFKVPIMPFRTQDNRIDGVVIPFVDISESKTLEKTLLETPAVLQSRFTDQTAELDAAKAQESVLQKTPAVLQKRFTFRVPELRQSREDLATERGRAK